MYSVAFLRAVNVGGNKLKTKALADQLGLVNLGAAGTFVGKRSPKVMAREIALALPFETDLFVCPGEEILRVVECDPFGPDQSLPDVKRFVTILAAAPARPPRLPMDQPNSPSWEVRITALESRYVFSLRYRRHPRALYPNAVVEKAFDAPATTRGWDTLVKVRDILAGPRP